MPFRNASRAAAAVVLAALAVLFAPAAAEAKIIELGSTLKQADLQCPTVSKEDPCQAVTRTTAYMARIDSLEDPFLVPRDGRIAAWTIVLAQPNKSDIEFFEAGFGGPARAGISVLEQQAKGSTAQRIVANSAVRNLRPYFGRRVQFPLVESLPVEKGQRVALTVPTWAPAFARAQGNKTAYRASRTKGETRTETNSEGEEVEVNDCSDFVKQTALLGIDAFAPFQCYYRTFRIAYTVTLITEPKPRKKKRPKPDDARSARSSAGRDAGAPRVLGNAGGAQSPVQ